MVKRDKEQWTREKSEMTLPQKDIKPRITVVGSLNMDLVISMDRMPAAGETLAGRELHTLPGGKGANQAAGCARLGAATSMIGRVGSDAFGHQMLEQMERMGVETEAIGIHESAPTGIASIYHTSEDNSIVIVAGANGECSPDWVEQHRGRIQQAQVLLVQLEVPLESVQRALEIARAAGVTTVLNPAPARELPAELLELADYLTPNETEFAALSGREAESEQQIAEALRGWSGEFRSRVIVTLGQRRLLVSGSERRAHHRARAQGSSGGHDRAGDTLNAALCVKLAELTAGSEPEFGSETRWMMG